MTAPKSAEQSQTQMTEMVLPQHTNPFGTTFGGVIMSWMDICAAITARRHSLATVVTASVDELHFLKPIRLGDTVILDAKLNSVGHSSMEVLVSVRVEPADLKSPPEITTQAFFTFVALGEDSKPTRVPRLAPQSPGANEDDENARVRRSHRLEAKENRKRGILKHSDD